MSLADNKNYDETIAKIFLLCIFNETPEIRDNKITITNFINLFGLGKLAIARLSVVPLDLSRG